MDFKRGASQLLTSHHNPKIKQIMRLRERKERDLTGLFLIEGERELTRAIDAGVGIDSLFLFEEHEGHAIAQKAATIYLCPKALFQKFSYRESPDGFLAIARQNPRSIDSLKSAKNPLFVVAESIEKPGNLGTILRSADGVSADGVIVCDRCTDVYNPNVVRASTGTLFTQSVIEESSEKTLAWLKASGIKILAATPHAKTLYTDADLTGPLAIVVGSEEKGLSKLWMERADLQVAIPMHGVSDSLNVATATTLLLYEALRQRSSKA